MTFEGRNSTIEGTKQGKYADKIVCNLNRMVKVKDKGIVIDSIHLVGCLTTGPKPLPNRALHIVRSRASSFNCEYPLLSLRSSSSFLCFLPWLPVTSIPPFIFPSITRRRRQFLRKMWPIQLAFRLLNFMAVLHKLFCSRTPYDFANYLRFLTSFLT